MIGLSHTTGYAIMSLSCLDNQACGCRSITDIAKCSSVPRPYLAKIIPALVRAGLITAKRGVGGGIRLARPPEKISLREIVEAIEGGKWLGSCLLGMPRCNDGKPCPTQRFWHDISGLIRRELSARRLNEFSAIEPRRDRPSRQKRQPNPCTT